MHNTLEEEQSPAHQPQPPTTATPTHIQGLFPTGELWESQSLTRHLLDKGGGEGKDENLHLKSLWLKCLYISQLCMEEMYNLACMLSEKHIETLHVLGVYRHHRVLRHVLSLSTSLILGYSGKVAQQWLILPQLVNWDLFFPIFQPPDYCPRAKGTGSHHFFRVVKPGKILLKGLTEVVLGVWKTSQNHQPTF